MSDNLQTAIGEELDDIGEILGMKRISRLLYTESDHSFRKRIQACSESHEEYVRKILRMVK